MALLMHLSNELKLLVISHLEAILLTDSEMTSEYDEEGDGNEDDFPPLPPHSSISPSLIALSQTNSLFRALLAPSIFATLTLQNMSVSGATISAIASGEDAKFVKKIEYVAKVPFPDWDGKGAAPKSSDFPYEAEHVLTHLSLFPNLETLSIQFPFHVESLREQIDGQDPLESAEVVREEEAKYGWRALMTSSYTAVAKNSVGVVKSLVLRNIVMKESSAWETEEWRSFLRGLTKFDVSMRGWDNGAGWATSTYDAYTDFIDNFDHYFFDHLDNVTHLTLSFNEWGTAGTGGGYIGPLCFKAKHMPYLQHLTLDFVIVGEVLVQLLRTHSKTIETIDMKHAYAIEKWWHGDLTWAEFFDALLANEPSYPNLRSCNIESPLLDWEAKDEARPDKPGEIRPRAVGIGRELLYAQISDKYGSILTDALWREHDPDKAEVKPRDWAAYEKFMLFVEANKQERKVGH